MAYEIPVQQLSLTAGADLSTAQYHAVKIDTSTGRVVLATAASPAIGILQDKPSAGKIATVMTLGVSKAVYGDTITPGSNLTPDASGHLTNASGSDPVVAVALEGGSVGEIRTVLLVTRVAAGVSDVSRCVVAIPVKLAKIAAAGDVVTEWTPGFSGAILNVAFVVTDPVTTASKAISLNLEINTTNVTGGVVNLTSANCGTLGAVVAGSAITGNNTFGATDKLSVEASSVTAFAEGEGVLLITIV